MTMPWTGGKLMQAPFPIAAPYRLMTLDTQPASGVQRIFDVAELSLRFLGAGVAAELAVAGKPNLPGQWFDRPLSMGALHGWLRDALKEEPPAGLCPFSEALRTCYMKKGPGTYSSMMDELVSARNRTRGHGVTLSEHGYRKLKQELEPKLEAALRELEPVMTFIPVVVKGINNFDGAWYEHQVLLAEGDNPFFPVATLRTAEPLPFRRVYLMGPGHSLTPLYPFMIYETCSRCDEDHLYLFEACQNGKARYLDPLKGCVYETQASREALTSKVEKAKGQKPTLGTGGLPAALDLTRGVEMGGRYVLDSELGRGAGGQVYRARDTHTGLDVALKVMKTPEPGIKAEPGTEPAVAVARFQREALAAARLNHTSIVRILDVGVDRGYQYIAMELLEGEELRKLLRKGPLPLEAAVGVCSQLLGALAVAHEAGVVHRDVKPENIILQSDGTAKLMDFGIARITGLTSITTPGEVVGTAGYMAPEQVEGKRADARADLFAIGALLYEMTTGRRPFEAPTVSETIAAILRRDPPPPSTLVPGLPAWFDCAVLTLLAKDPSQRPQSAKDTLTLLSERTPKRPSGGVLARLSKARAFRRLEKPDLECVHPLEVRALNLGFGGKRVLKGLDLQVPRGTRYCLLGRNGAGKTTLIRCIMGFYKPEHGAVKLFGTARARRSDTFRRVGYIPETPNAYPFMRLGHFLSHLASLYPEWDRRWVSDLVGRYGFSLEDRIGSMSRGMRTMVSVLAAFGHKPPLLVFDDPTLGLDAFWIQDFLKTVADLTAARGTTVLFSTHNFEAVEGIADRIGFLDEGQICFEFNLQDLPRRFCEVRFVMPGDDDPDSLPADFTVLERKKRTVSGIFQIGSQKPEDAFAHFKPAFFETAPASLKDVYFHVLRKSRVETLSEKEGYSSAVGSPV